MIRRGLRSTNGFVFSAFVGLLRLSEACWAGTCSSGDRFGLFGWPEDRILSDFRCQLGPTWTPKITKIQEKSMPRCLSNLTSFSDRFVFHFCSQLRSLEPQKSLKFRWFCNIFHKIDLSKLTSMFHQILVPTCHDFPSQNLEEQSSYRKARYDTPVMLMFCLLGKQR